MTAPPPRLEQLQLRDWTALALHARRLRHDLGKYVAFQVRWLPDPPAVEELRQALQADLARTRQQGASFESAPSIWARLRPALVGEQPLEAEQRVRLAADPDLVVIDAALAGIQELLPRLEVAPLRDLLLARDRALQVAGAARRFDQRVRRMARLDS